MRIDSVPMVDLVGLGLPGRRCPGDGSTGAEYFVRHVESVSPRQPDDCDGPRVQACMPQGRHVHEEHDAERLKLHGQIRRNWV